MKTVLLMRHAKSSWDNPALDDHERPLNKRGQSAAPRIGQLIRDEGICPQVVVSSTAVRAESTARIVAQECGFKGEIVFTDDLYLAPPSQYLGIISGLDDTYGTVLLVGHNPGISELVSGICNQPVSMPTAALAVTRTQHETWKGYETEPASELVNFWRPKQLD